MEILIPLATLTLLILAYLIPTIVACNRKSTSGNIICILNVFLGFTGIVWLLLLVWACTGKTEYDVEREELLIDTLKKLGDNS